VIRVVLDTNVVVSALLCSGGFPEAVFNLAMDREIQLRISAPILAEYEEVLHRPGSQSIPTRSPLHLPESARVASWVRP
jgi:putative PIN family toxin of toxin-antitoxin system